MNQTVDIRELNARIEQKSSFVNMITYCLRKSWAASRNFFRFDGVI